MSEHTTVEIPKLHTCSSDISRSLQMTSVADVVLGHLPQLVALILYSIDEHSAATASQLKLSRPLFTFVKDIFVGDRGSR